MRTRTHLIGSLESYRQQQQQGPVDVMSERVRLAWIFHDNSLEGRCFKPEEILGAVRQEDQRFPSYMRPLLEDVRLYEEAIRMVGAWAKKGVSELKLDNLEQLHKHLCRHEPKEGAKVRRNSPVHRDYHQVICGPKEISKRLEQFFLKARDTEIDTLDVLSFAASLHHELMFIYPYRRQPGLLARLFTNQFLLTHKYPPIILASHERGAYYDALAAHDSAALTQLFYQAAWRFLDMKSNARTYQRKSVEAS